MFSNLKDSLNGMLLNRMLIAVLSALGGVIATAFGPLFAAFCGQ